MVTFSMTLNDPELRLQGDIIIPRWIFQKRYGWRLQNASRESDMWSSANCAIASELARFSKSCTLFLSKK